MSARDNDPTHLHPVFRGRDLELLRAVRAAFMPILPYEGWRDPNRQAFLFTEGRVDGVGTPGHHVTFEMAWRSLHQYGLARDWVWFVDGAWTWTAPAGWSWDQFHDLARAAGLVPLSFEQPHVQLPGVSARDILFGTIPYPAGGDDSWEANLEAAITSWGSAPKFVSGIQMPAAPPLVSSRPVIPPPPPGMVYDNASGLCIPA